MTLQQAFTQAVQMQIKYLPKITLVCGEFRLFLRECIEDWKNSLCRGAHCERGKGGGVSKLPDSGDVFVTKDYAMVFQIVNFQEMTAKVKLFKSQEDALKWIHDVSRKQNPEWHDGNCEKCQKEQGENGPEYICL